MLEINASQSEPFLSSRAPGLHQTLSYIFPSPPSSPLAFCYSLACPPFPPHTSHTVRKRGANIIFRSFLSCFSMISLMIFSRLSFPFFTSYMTYPTQHPSAAAYSSWEVSCRVLSYKKTHYQKSRKQNDDFFSPIC